MYRFDTPIMRCYLAGMMIGNKVKDCTNWRRKIREYYNNWKEAGTPYPIVFTDPCNGESVENINKTGENIVIPSNAIRDGDFLAVKKTDIVVINLDNFGSNRISWGTPTEMSWALDLWHHPVITIVPETIRGLEKHPFIQRSSWIVQSVDEMLEKKILNYFYKRISGAIY